MFEPLWQTSTLLEPVAHTQHNLPTSDSPWKWGCIEMVLASSVQDYLNTPLCNLLPNLVLSNVLAQDRNIFLQVYTMVKL